LKAKLESVSRAHSDVQNLMAATDVGILFLDPQLRINRFTPRISDLFNLVAGDEGRSISDFTHRLDYEDLAGDAREVLRDLGSIEREVHGHNGGWYLTRLRPYRTIEDKIDGVVVTFVDIGERRRAADALKDREARMRVLVGELQHRTRNLIGVVTALADTTGGQGQTLRGFKASFKRSPDGACTRAEPPVTRRTRRQPDLRLAASVRTLSPIRERRNAQLGRTAGHHASFQLGASVGHGSS
jgi:hypothetical protein